MMWPHTGYPATLIWFMCTEDLVMWGVGLKRSGAAIGMERRAPPMSVPVGCELGVRGRTKRG